MTDLRYYNTDPRYEMMLAILPDPQFDNLPDAAQILEDLKEVVRLCHHYTLDDDTPNERPAWELAQAIVAHLMSEWSPAPDLAKMAHQYWVPDLGKNDVGDEGASTAADTLPGLEGDGD